MFKFADHAADLGFTIHGGVDNPRIPGDPGIFINHVIPGSLVDRKLRSGDRVLSVSAFQIKRRKYQRYNNLLGQCKRSLLVMLETFVHEC